MRRLKHCSVFSGIEGFALAAGWAGIDTVFSCEIDRFCREVIRKNFPKAIIYEDVRNTDFRRHRGKIDILTGGFPCQPFSVAGQRKGAGDDRYLWPEMLRVIDEVRPAWVIGENVAGIASMVQPGEVINVESHSDLFGEDNYTIETERAEYVIETVCRNLEGIGYSVQPFIIPACAVGAPHRRDRIWIIAHADFERCKNEQEGQKQSLCNPIGYSTLEKQTRDKQQCRACKYDRTSADTHGKQQLEGWAERERTSDKQTDRRRVFFKPLRFSEVGIAANPTGFGRRELRDTIKKEGARCSYELLARKYPIPNWDNFPTVSPIHTRNDGISAELLRQRIREDSMGLLSEKEIDEIFSKANTKLREEGVKASGNAIVPQVAYEILKIIKDIEQ